MTRSDLLQVLKEFVEARRPHTGWNAWWCLHASEVEAVSDYFTYLMLKRRGIGGAIEVLKKEGLEFKNLAEVCRKCGEALFIAMPGRTTPEEIRAFAKSSKFSGREEIARDGWIHPGKYCSSGCTEVLWHIKSPKKTA